MQQVKFYVPCFFVLERFFYFLEKWILVILLTLSIVQSQRTLREGIEGSSLLITQDLFCYNCFGSWDNNPEIKDITLTLSISQWQIVKAPNLGQSLFRSRTTITQSLDDLTTVVLKILTVHLGLFLSYLLTLSISQWKIVKVPNLGQRLLKSKLLCLKLNSNASP